MAPDYWDGEPGSSSVDSKLVLCYQQIEESRVVVCVDNCSRGGSNLVVVAAE